MKALGEGGGGGPLQYEGIRVREDVCCMNALGWGGGGGGGAL